MALACFRGFILFLLIFFFCECGEYPCQGKLKVQCQIIPVFERLTLESSDYVNWCVRVAEVWLPQWLSVATNGHQWSSVAVDGCLWPPVAVDGCLWPLVAISGHGWLSVAISGCGFCEPVVLSLEAKVRALIISSYPE